jgi:autotransporter-associated beta strand protein
MKYPNISTQISTDVQAIKDAVANRFARTTGIAVLLIMLLSTFHAEAATKYWDTTAGAGNGVGGTGTWTAQSTAVFSTASTGDATLSAAASTDDDVFQGTAGTITLEFNPTANSLTFNTSGYTLMPDASTRTVTGPITIGAGVTLNLLNSATNLGQQLIIGSVSGGDANSEINIVGKASGSNADRVSIGSNGSTISVPTTISTTGKGVAGYVATATGAIITGNITNNSANAITDLGATSGNDLTVNAVITGTAPLQFSAGNSGGTGTIILKQQNTYTGTTTFNAAAGGVVKLGTNNAIPTATDVSWGLITAGSTFGGILDLNGFNQTVGSLTTNTTASGYITNSGSASGTNTLTISGSTSPTAFGFVIADGPTSKLAVTRAGTGTTILSGANTFRGPVTITGGIINFFTATNLSKAAINFGGGTLQYASGNTADISTRTVTLNSGGGTIDTGVNSVTFANAIGNSGTGGLTKAGGGKLTLNGANTYYGNTTVSSGTLALSGSSSIANSLNIIIGSGATLDVSGLTSTFALGSSQTLSNSTSTSSINGNINTASGIISLTYGGTPALTMTNGILAFSATTTFKVNNTGSALAAGKYKLVSTNAGSAVAGTVPAVTVGGNGTSGVTTNFLTVSNSELYLVVDHPPTANPSTYYRPAGIALRIPIAGLATNWSDLDGDTVFLTNMPAIYSTNGASVNYDSQNVTYSNLNNVADQINYT